MRAKTIGIHPQWGEVTIDALSGQYRLVQRLRGHRWSTDDLLTAWYASRVAAGPERVLDLGSGIGSVLLMLAWVWPRARLTGVEAQPMSAAMARVSARLNGCHERVSIINQDMREPGLALEQGPFDLITGTPPYIPATAGVASPDPQKAAARLELRGSIADYAATASRFLAPGGVFVFVFTHREARRAEQAVAHAGLSLFKARSVITRKGREPFLRLFAAVKGLENPFSHEEPLTVRQADGSWSREYKQVRRQMGMPA